MSISEKVKTMVKSFLDIQEPNGISANIQQLYSLDSVFFINDLWYRGQANELHSFYSQIDDDMGQNSFWASRPTESFNFPKTHSGLPFLMVEMLVSIMTNDMVEINVSDEQQTWNKIAKDNNLQELLENSFKGILVKGDGAFKISYDTDVSKYPIIEWWDGDRVDFEIKRGRIVACIFKSNISVGNKKYELKERYSKKGINYSLYYDGKEVEIPEELAEYRKAVINQNEFMMAVPVKYGASKLFKNRGEGIINKKIPQFDNLDEVISLWRLANRKGQIKTYIPENLLPKTAGGYHHGLNYFDNDYIATEPDIREGVAHDIHTTRAEIPAEELLSAYVTALDACLCGVISPSTLGIDVKKLDNAESQREKEKTTLYTRGRLVTIYQTVIPQLVNAALKTYSTFQKSTVKEVDVDVNFGEYANPSFEAVIETMSKARGAGNAVMSIEAQVDELWGDAKDSEWKKQEVKRLKEQGGIFTTSEPAVNDELDMEDEIDINE